MDLKGATLRQFFTLTDVIGTTEHRTNRILKVPHYQRPYKWGEEGNGAENRISELINDWMKECSIGSTERYFAGALVTVADPQSNEHHLIDGQQRITTIYLLNYLVFLIARETIAIGINARRNATISIYDALNTSSTYLFTTNNQNHFSIKKEDIEKALDSTDSDEIKQFSKKYHDSLALSNIYGDESSRLTDNFSRMGNLLNTLELRLQYSRAVHNTTLKEALSKVSINSDLQTNPTLNIYNLNLIPENSLEKTYINAIKIIFEKFKNLTTTSTTESGFDFCRKMIEILNQFLESIELAVIQTGNPEDAYTLFEVLNDRALALQDLDLLKNAFYKSFCDQSTSFLSATQIDAEVSAREDQWGRIFGNNTDTNKIHISFLSVCYLTRKNDSNKADKLRKLINTDYLNKYDRTLDRYNENELIKDFNIIETVRFLVNIFHFKAQKLNQSAIEAELSSNTITYKLIHLLLALNQTAVLAGFTNFILRHIENSNVSFDPNKSKLLLDELAKGIDANGNNTLVKHDIVHEQAKALWKCVMQNDSHHYPLQLANSLVSNFYRGSNNPLCVYYGHGNKTSLSEWLNTWKYGKADLKIKILFIKLISSRMDVATDKLIKSSLSTSIQTPELIHLDHLEPRNPANNLEYYNFGDISRDDDINALGNMFPLFANLNSVKNNAPLDQIFNILSAVETALDHNNHWFTKETYDLLQNNHNLSTSGHLVPIKSFFDERRSRIINRFDEVIQIM